jgi:hypothetical protein
LDEAPWTRLSTADVLDRGFIRGTAVDEQKGGDEWTPTRQGVSGLISDPSNVMLLDLVTRYPFLWGILAKSFVGCFLKLFR